MDIREFVINSVSRMRESTLRLVQELSQEDLRWQPASFANPVGFLLFHIFRVEDRYFRRWLGGTGEIWEREGWAHRWNLPERDPTASETLLGDTGVGWTPEQVAAWEPPPKTELLDYGQRVRENTLLIIAEFDLTMLNVVPNPDRPNFTYTYYLHQASHHEAQHQGQIDYLIGLMRGQMGV